MLVELFFKVAEDRFKGPLLNSTLLLKYLCSGARFFARVKQGQPQMRYCHGNGVG